MNTYRQNDPIVVPLAEGMPIEVTEVICTGACLEFWDIVLFVTPLGSNRRHAWRGLVH